MSHPGQRVTENVLIEMFPTAKAMNQDLVRPCLERSYQTFLDNSRKLVTSQYIGRTLTVVTTDDGDGRCVQFVFCDPDVPLLSEEQQADLRKTLAGEPSKQGLWVTEL